MTEEAELGKQVYLSYQEFKEASVKDSYRDDFRHTVSALDRRSKLKTASDVPRTKLQTTIIIFTLCASISVAALDTTIIATAIPTISEHFGSTAGYTRIGTAYLLACAVSNRSWGKFSDIWGRNPILLLACLTFFVGSLLAGVSLNNSIPLLGFGAGSLWFKDDHNVPFDESLVESAEMAIRMGFIHLDTAEFYGTEAEIGKAIAQSLVPREKFFITTKVLPNISNIAEALTSSLSKLGLEHVDLYLIHAPFFAETDADLQEAWSAMERVKESGKARSIGVSNFNGPHLEAILKTAKYRPVVNQIEFHLYLQHGDLLEYHRQQNIALTAYAPLTPIRVSPGPVDKYLEELARKYRASTVQVLLRWCIDQDVVPITTSAKADELNDYMRSMSFQLTPTEVEAIAIAGREKHYSGFWQPHYAEDDRT